MEIDYKHTWRVSEKHPLVRTYRWAWATDAVDFCRLFWGSLFLPLNLLVRLSLFPFWVLWRGGRATNHVIAPVLSELASHRKEKREKRKMEHALALADLPPVEKPAKPKREGPSVPSKILTFVAHGLQAGWFRLSSFGSRISGPLGRGLVMTVSIIRWPLIVAAPIMTALAIFLLIKATGHTMVTWGAVAGDAVGTAGKVSWHWTEHNGPQVAGVVAIFGVLGVAMLSLILSLRWVNSIIEDDYSHKRKPRKKFKETAIGSSFLLLKEGAIAFKSHTCPKIEVIGDERGAPKVVSPMSYGGLLDSPSTQDKETV